jgi:hypothetical protein
MAAPNPTCAQYAAAFPASAQPTAAAVCTCESGGNPNARALTAYEDSRGLWQVNLLAHPQYASVDLYDPAVNVQAALAISSNGTNWQPWSTYTNGCYTQYLDYAGGSASPLADVSSAVGSSVAAATGSGFKGALFAGGIILGLLALDDVLSGF